MKVLLTYKQDVHKAWELQVICGNKRQVNVDRMESYDQEEEIEVGNVEKRIKELKSFSNRNYHTFRVKELA